MVHNSTHTNCVRGVLERLFFVETNGQFHEPWTPTQDFNKTLLSFKTELLNTAQRTAKLTWDQFLAQYSGRKRAMNEAAVLSLAARPLRRSDAFVDTFVKAEWVSMSKDGPPRMIQPRSRRFNCYIGRWIKAIEHKVYEALNKMLGGVVVAKGLNAEERASALRTHWVSLKDPVAVLLDVSRFDQHVNLESLEWEHSVYEWFFPGDREFAKLLSWMRTNIGYARTRDGTVKYRLKGKRMSGDMSTALGNVLLMTAILVSFLQKGLPSGTWRILDDGDDCALLLERSQVERCKSQLPDWYRSHGFKLKIEQVTDVFEQISFCQSSPVFSRGRWLMVRNPKPALEKDLLQTVLFRNEREWREKRAAVAGCGLALSGDIPIYSSVFRMLGSDGISRSQELVTGRDFLARGMETKSFPPDDDSRLTFYRAFDITPEEQKALEGFYDSIQPVWCKPVPVGKELGTISEIIVN